MFWNSQDQLANKSTTGTLTQNFYSVLAFPFWLFNNNNWGNVDIQLNTTISTLPAEFYTQVSLVEPYVKLSFLKSMFITFLALQSVVIVCIWALFIAAYLYGRGAGSMLKQSEFPLFDLAFKATLDGLPPGSMLHMGTGEIIKVARGTRTVLKK